MFQGLSQNDKTGVAQSTIYDEGDEVLYVTNL